MSNDQWVQWLAATLVAGISGTFALIVYAHGTFPTKENAQIKDEYIRAQITEIKDHLMRIETKLDRKNGRSD